MSIQLRRVMRVLSTRAALCIVYAASAESVVAQSPAAVAALPAKLAAYMEPLTAMSDFSGRILVAVNGRIVLDSAFTASGDAPSSPATRFGIGSITKTFTAAAVAVLVKRGTLRLSDTLSRFVPEVSNWPAITIAQLLGHSAGVPDYYVQPDYTERRATAITPSAFALWIGGKPLEFPPGTRSSYSNSGYALLALVVERASKRSFDRFVKQELLGPAGLTATGALIAVSGSLAPGHNPAAAPKYLQSPIPFDLSWLHGSGSMYSTTVDLLRWVRALRSDSLFAFSTQPYPFGWGAHEWQHERVIEQTARIPAGYASQITQFRDRDVTIVILSAVQADVVTPIRDAIAAMLFERPYEVPVMRQVLTIADSISARLVGRYEFAPGFVVSVRRQGSELELAGPDGDFFPLDAVERGTYFYRVLQVSIRFGVESDGKEFLLWNGSGKAMRVAM